MMPSIWALVAGDGDVGGGGVNGAASGKFLFARETVSGGTFFGGFVIPAGNESHANKGKAEDSRDDLFHCLLLFCF